MPLNDKDKKEWFSPKQKEHAEKFRNEHDILMKLFEDLVKNKGASTISSIITGLIRLDNFGWLIEAEDRQEIKKMQREQIKINNGQKKINLFLLISNILLLIIIGIQTAIVVLTYIKG